jgi:transcription elongation factor GreA-like protein
MAYKLEKEKSMERDQGQFPKGVLVNHAVYGVGRVVQVEGTGKDEKVTIEFPGQVKKKFLVRCTPITMMR